MKDFKQFCNSYIVNISVSRILYTFLYTLQNVINFNIYVYMYVCTLISFVCMLFKQYLSCFCLTNYISSDFNVLNNGKQ